MIWSCCRETGCAPRYHSLPESAGNDPAVWIGPGTRQGTPRWWLWEMVKHVSPNIFTERKVIWKHTPTVCSIELHVHSQVPSACARSSYMTSTRTIATIMMKTVSEKMPANPNLRRKLIWTLQSIFSGTRMTVNQNQWGFYIGLIAHMMILTYCISYNINNTVCSKRGFLISACARFRAVFYHQTVNPISLVENQNTHVLWLRIEESSNAIL